MDGRDPHRTTRTLDYGRDRRPALRPWRLVAIAVLVLALAGGSWSAGRVLRGHAQDVLWGLQASRHVEAPAVVVYESDPGRAAELVAGGRHVSAAPADAASKHVSHRPPPASYAGLTDVRKHRHVESLHRPGTLLFLHELQTPAGLRRTVAVRFLPEQLGGTVLPGPGLMAHVFEPGPLAGWLDPPSHLHDSHAPLVQAPLPRWLTDAPSRLAGVSDRLADLRWFAGQPDREDRRRFSINYEVAGVRGTIDGYLDDDGRHVRFEVRRPAPPTDARLRETSVGFSDDNDLG